MNVSTPDNKLLYLKLLLGLFLSIVVFSRASAQTTTSWTGATNTKWEDAGNWTSGVPDTTKHVIIGDIDFKKQPESLINNQGNNSGIKCLSLTVGGAYASTLTLSNDVGLYVKGDVTIKPNGTVINKTTHLIIRGNWVNDGTYTEEVTVQNQNWVNIHKVDFGGANQTIGGTSVTKFLQLEVWGNLTLQQNLTIDLPGYNYGNLVVHERGVIDPQSYKISWDNTKANKAFRLMNGATAKVKATNYLDNYSIYPTPAYNTTTIEHTSTIEYAGTIDQNIDYLITYQKLVISGSGVKRLTGPTTVSSGATNTQVNVNQATLDLGTYSLTRQAAGGSFTVAAGATVKIGGPANTPDTFTSRTFDPTSTVEYYGAAQTVQHNTYGHLTLSNTGVKTMPGTAMTVAGNLTSSGTTQYTAGNGLTVGGNVTIGAGSTFNGASFAHTIAGNWVNNGTFTPGTSIVTFNGANNTTITGATTFNGLTINKAATTNYVTLNSNATATTLSLTSGDLYTGANKVTVLGSRAGTGWVVGTITRQHAFTAGTAYAFNGPYATLTFTTASGVGEVTMKSGQAGFTPGSFPNGKSINRMYEVQVATGTFTGASLQLQYKDSELNGCEEDGLKLYSSPAATGPWTTASRHAYDATQNWVRRNNLATINGFWTLTDNPSTYKWDGNTNIAWEDGRNWEVWTDGAMTRGITGPISSDFVELGSLEPIRQPTISAAEWVKSIQFFGINQNAIPKAVALTVASGSLKTNGNIAATGGGTAIQHTLAAGAQPVNIGGNLILNDGSTGNSITLTSTTGTTTVAGGIQQRNTGSITLGSGTLNVGGDYTYEAGGFTAGTSTVNYNGAAGQVVASVPYHHLTINKSAGTATLTSAATQSITGNLSVVSGTLAVSIPTINVAGKVTLTGGGLQANASTINLKGDWERTGGTFTPGTNTVIFSGTGAQLVAGTTFNNLSKTGTGTLTTTGSSTLAGNLDVQSGSLVLNGHTMNRAGAGGALTLADNATMQINGVSVYPTGFGTNTLGVNSTVIYSGGSAAIEGVTYGKLTLQNSSTRPLKGNTRVANLMTINTNSILNDNTTGYTLTLDNDLLNNGNINALSTNLNFTSPTAKLNGAGTGATIVKDMTVASGAGLTVSKNLTLYGNLTNSGTTFNASANQVLFTGAAAAAVTSANPITINNLLVSKTGATTAVTLAADINGLQSINVTSGTLDAANRILTKKSVSGTTLTVANAATMIVRGTNSLPLFDSYTLQPTSTVVYNGSNQSIKSVQYGHLSLQSTGTATFEAGIARIAGNMIKGAEATVITPETIEFNGAVNQTVAGVTFRKLLISAAGNKTLTGNARVEEKLTLNAGMVLTDVNEITLAENAVLEGEQESSFVLGTIKTTRTVPANVRSTFGGIGIALTPAVEAGLSTMTRVTGTAVGYNSNSIKRYFRFQPELNAGKFNATIEASYLTADLVGHVEADLQLYSARFLGDGWTAISAVDPARTTKTIAATGVNSVNFLTFGTSIKPLPVELVYFKAAKSGTDAVLEWKTASEQNNSGFEVEASADGRAYEVIGFVKSVAGTSAQAHTYTFTDSRNGKNGVLYYRLRQVDTDGTYKYYGPRAVDFGTVMQTAATAYPNPFRADVKVALEAVSDGKASLTVYTTAGKIVLQQQEQLTKGTSLLRLNLGENLPHGLYLLTVEMGGKTQTLKLIKE